MKKNYKDFEKECGKAIDKIAQRTTAIKINEARLYLNMIYIVALKHIKQSCAIDNMFLRNDLQTNKTLYKNLLLKK